MNLQDKITAMQVAQMGRGSFIASDGQQEHVSGPNQNQSLHQMIALLIQIRDLLKKNEKSP